MSYESFDDIKLDLAFKVKRGHLVLHTQQHTSGGYTFTSGTDAGRPLSSYYSGKGMDPTIFDYGFFVDHELF